MKRKAELLLFVILSLLLVIEPVALANEKAENNVIIKKDNIKKFWLNLENLYESIINETSKNGLGIINDDKLVMINRFIQSSKDLTIPYENIYYLQNFFKKADKSISEYLPIDVSQIDIASENLPGLFIKQIMGLIAPFFTTVGEGISLLSVSILTFLAVPFIPLMLVVALIVGIIGLILGVVIGIPVALIVGLIGLLSLSGGGDNSTKSTAFMANNIEIYKLLKKYPLDSNLLYTDYKIVSQDNLTKIFTPIMATIGKFFDQIMSTLTGTVNSAIKSGVLKNMFLAFSVTLIGVPVVLIFAALVVTFIIVATLSSPFFLPIILFIAIGFAIAAIGFTLFSESKNSLSIEKSLTYYDVIAKSVASAGENPLKNLDIIVKNILSFSRKIFKKKSYMYFDKLESIILTYDLKTDDGIKKATDEVLEFIPQIR